MAGIAASIGLMLAGAGQGVGQPTVANGYVELTAADGQVRVRLDHNYFQPNQ